MQLQRLNSSECRILEFVVLLHAEQLLDNAMDYLGGMALSKVPGVLSVVLGLPFTEIRDALNGNAPLISSGIIKLDKAFRDDLKSKLRLISGHFADRVLSDGFEMDSLLSNRVTKGHSPQLGFDDFNHLGRDVKLLRRYLTEIHRTRQCGVNVLLHGQPGTGKTELAKLLTKALGCEPYEVSSQNENGDTVDGAERLRALRVAQAFFKHKGALLIFDEAEDIFNDGNWFGMKSTAQTHKGWMNRMLETNPVPVVWITNSIECIDPAFIRRFDIVLEVPLPSKRQREQMIRQECGELIDSQALARIASADNISPAVIARAANVVRTLQGSLASKDVPRTLECLVENTLVAQGHPKLSKSADQLPAHYSPQFINADSDLTQAAQGIARAKSARLCLYGPPGTGKSAYGRWLADQLGVPLHIKRGSDLLSKWVGGTEENIARAFAEAEADGAVLLLDEVDSFLQDRRGASRSWEVTEVNEMLTQMESFEGVFIATTNLMVNLDQAALRRFDLKVKFDYLRPEQAWALFLQQCKALKIRKPPIKLKLVLERIQGLTPGDFATVARRNRFQPIANAQELIEALMNECLVKNDGVTRRIGFL